MYYHLHLTSFLCSLYLAKYEAHKPLLPINTYAVFICRNKLNYLINKYKEQQKSVKFRRKILRNVC
jgi:hypothetical protein